jgi:hypothetical protein
MSDFSAFWLFVLIVFGGAMAGLAAFGLTQSATLSNTIFISTTLLGIWTYMRARDSARPWHETLVSAFWYALALLAGGVVYIGVIVAFYYLAR